MACGNRNTKFFHTQTVVRRRRNKIHGLNLEGGVWCTDEDLLKTEAQSFYKNLFCSNENIDLSYCSDIVMPILKADDISSLLRPVDMEEVKQAVFVVGSYKALGPDGFQPVFFKNYWEMVGTEVYRVVNHAFVSGSIDPCLAEMLIVLIPKVDHQVHMREFRPISLCNVLYKIITKVIVNRIRPFLHDLVGLLQGSFIPGRGSLENIIVAQETFIPLINCRERKGMWHLKLTWKRPMIEWTGTS